MQTREQVRNWKVIGSLATVAALGVSGLAIASTPPTENPPPIELDDKRALDTNVTTVTTIPFEVVPGQSFSIDSGESLDSPLASGDLDTGSLDSPADSLDSPNTAPAPTTAVSVDSPDSPDRAPAPPANDSPDSADSPASADSADSLDS